MDSAADDAIRASFVNCSKGEARRLNLPTAFPETPWPDLDFLGWRDPGAPDRGYLVVERDGRLTGFTLRVPPRVNRSLTNTALCSICLTGHSGSGVSLLTAPKVGAAGRQGNTVGVYMCDDLACSLYVRGKKKSARVKKYEESLTEGERIIRLRTNLDLFLDRVMDLPAPSTAAR
ncbi:FBP domain-containing protein [Nocardiopsis ansamitocini]|uniref:Elongation factor G-binding protein C-terminal treble-clef zinc-finger domain-containing protein n=1 Tax=Nocardiopsis ansamitocini TaxID=1670832 RepID=A0A9W6P6G4_9ACTN|nr:FBP domain-containing protein [Nocardiopsis ansamitocini]GLU47923.1 hypothetical protein Nans01_22740 [Nocardiopsis ansamitocini]